MIKQSCTHQSLSKSLEYRTLVQLLDNRTSEHPGKEAFVLYDESRERSCLTFGEWQAKSQALAAALLDKGLVRGDRVALMSPNSIEFVVSLLALYRIGANVIAIEQESSEGEIVDRLMSLKCTGLVCFLHENEARRKPLTKAILSVFAEGEALADRPAFKAVVTFGSHAEWDYQTDHIHEYGELLRLGSSLEMSILNRAQDKVQFDDPALVLLTSGSTGRPKVCQFTHHALVNGCYMGYSIDTRVFGFSPFTWVPGMGGLCSTIATGATAIMVPPAMIIRQRATEFTLDILSKEKCTDAPIAVYLMHDIVTNQSLLGKYDLSCLRSLSTGGQPVPLELMKSFLGLFPRLTMTTGYGATETFSFVSVQTFCGSNIGPDEYGWMEVVPGTEVKIVDPEDCVIPLGKVGEINVRGPMIFLERLDKSEEPWQSKSRTGWWRSCDMGKMDDKGRIKIFGRKGDAINRAGDTLYPAEFEKVLAEHPSIARVTVVGVPDKRLTEETCACVILKESGDEKSKRAELEAWYEQQWPPNPDGLSGKPGYTIFLEKFPLTRTRKTDRAELRKIAVMKLGIKSDRKEEMN